MLIIKAFVNDKQIDEVHVQNVKHVAGDTYLYKVRKPKGCKCGFAHSRSDGWRELAANVLSKLADK